MRLKCFINGKEYKVVQGATFSEEYNETLDSGTIILDQVSRIEDLKPYDDVFVYSVGEDENEFLGYRNSSSCLKTFKTTVREEEKEIVFDKREIDSIYKSTSYTVATQTIIMPFILKNSNDELQEKNAQIIYFPQTNSYFLEIRETSNTSTMYDLEQEGNNLVLYYGDDYDVLFVGYCAIRVNYTNELEKPSFYKHLLVYQYTEERLNPLENIYKYKIELCSETMRLEKIQLPNISITQPLNIELKKSVYDYARQFLSMYNPKIKVDASRLSRQWLYRPKYELSSEIYTIFSDVYCPDFTLDNPSLKDVLHQLFLTKDRIPYVKDDVICALDITQRHGTFNTNGVYSINGSMSLDNYADNLKRTYQSALSEVNTAKRVEYLGFRNSDTALMTTDNMRLETKFPIYKINKIYMCYYKKVVIVNGETETQRDMVFLCKQDITPLVKLEQVRSQLSEDWDDFENNPPETIEQMAQYKLCTVGYNIGDTKITGWGTKYTYPMGWWDITKSYIENIFQILDDTYQYGIYSYGYVSKDLDVNEVISNVYSSNALDRIVSPFTSTSRLKSFFFEVEYEAFYNGTIITSKDGARDDITTNDNSSSSLTLLEKDGLFQKEKANRFGNMAYSIMANYNTIDELQELGSVYDDDVIIYSRQYQVWNNIIKASYSGTKDYVLKNYFTSVYSKHRPTALMDYSQSTNRAENKKMYIMLSKNTLYYEDLHFTPYNLPVSFENFDGLSFLDEILSFAIPSPIAKSVDKIDYNQKINYGYFEDGQGNRYASDINTFTSGYSLCFNIAMWDNITMGNYIKSAKPSMNPNAESHYATGSLQNFYSFVDSTETGYKDTMSAFVSHIPEDANFNDIVQDYYNGIANDLYNPLFALPKVEQTIDETNKIGNFYSFYKDNKEVIDLTMQIEAFTNDDDIIFSEWMLRLSDLNGVYHKVDETYIARDVGEYNDILDIYTSTLGYPTSLNGEIIIKTAPAIIIKIPNAIYEQLSNNKTTFSDNWVWRGNMASHSNLWLSTIVSGYRIKNMYEIKSVVDDKITFNATVVKKWTHGLFGGTTTYEKDVELTFTKVDSIGNLDFTGDTNNVYFTNIWEDTSVLGSYFLREDSGFEYTVEATNGIFISNNISLGDFNLHELKVGGIHGEPKTYYKNMFIKLDETPIKKTLVYNEYKVGDLEFSNLNVADVIENTTQEETTKIIRDFASFIDVKLSQIPDTTKSIQMWYNDNGTLHFVFGVNLNDEDFERGYVRIYLSTLSKRDTRIYNENHLVIGKIKNLADDIEEDYGKYQLYEIASN